MKRFIVLLTVLCLLASGCLAEAVPSAAQNPTLLTTVGTAEVELRHDYGILHFALEETAPTITGAQQRMDNMLAALRAALQAQGIADGEIHGANYEVHATYEYNYTKYSEQRILTGYNVQTTLEVPVADTETAVQLISAVDEAGVKCGYDLTFESRGDLSAYDAALEAAAQEALRKAQVLADASGLTLDTLISIEEISEREAAAVQVTYTVK